MKTDLINKEESREPCLPERDLEHVRDEEDDEGDPHEKDDHRRDASLQLILPLGLACI